MWNYKIELSICRWTVKRNEHVLDNYYKSTSLLSPIPTPPCLHSLKTCIGLMACSTQTPPSSWGELMSLWISQAFQFLDHLIFINHLHSTLDTHSHGDVITLNFPIFEIFVPKIPLTTALSFDLKEFFKHLVNPFLSLLLFRKILDCMFISSVVLLSIPKFLAPLSFHHGHLQNLYPGNLAFPFLCAYYWPLALHVSLFNLIWVSVLPGNPSSSFRLFPFSSTLYTQ